MASRRHINPTSSVPRGTGTAMHDKLKNMRTSSMARTSSLPAPQLSYDSSSKPARSRSAFGDDSVLVDEEEGDEGDQAPWCGMLYFVPTATA